MSTSKKFSVNQKGLVRRSLGEVGFAPILIVLILTAALVGGYLVYTNYKLPVFDRTNNRTKMTQPLPTTQPSSTPSDITYESTTSAVSPAPNGAGETANWKTFTNTKYGIQFSYPSNFKAGEYTSDNGILLKADFSDDQNNELLVWVAQSGGVGHSGDFSMK